MIYIFFSILFLLSFGFGYNFGRRSERWYKNHKKNKTEDEF